MEKIDVNNIANIQQNGMLYYCVKSLDNDDWVPILICHPAHNRTITTDGQLYRDDRYITITSNRNICSLLPKDVLNSVIKDAVVFITSRGFLVDIAEDDFYLNQYIKEINNISLVKDITRFPYDGEIPLDDEIMQELCLEKPIRKACLDLNKNGIETLMSSANGNDILNKDISVDESKIYIGKNDPWSIGNGYAWIMLDWDRLSDDNKKYLISIKNGDLDLDLNTDEINNLKHNAELNGKKAFQDQLIKLYEYVDVSREFAELFDFDSNSVVANMQLFELPQDDYYDLNKVFLMGHNSLNNHIMQNKGNCFRTVVIRYPMNEKTTVADVEKFYDRIVREMIKNNKRIPDDISRRS